MEMRMLMENKVAIVTGGGSGIGRAAVLLFATQGAKVVVADLNLDAAEESVAMVSAQNGHACAIKADVGVEAEVRAMVDKTVAVFGRLDCAFNNAGIGKLGRRIEEYRLETFEAVMRTNLIGIWLCMKYEILQMRAQPGMAGTIVNNASAMGLVGTENGAPYAASKHGVVGLTRSAALDHARTGIRVNAVCPGLVLTPMAGPIAPEMSNADLVDRQPIGRWAAPKEIAEAVLWLCSDLSSIVTGAAIAVDGGWTAQ